jgi:hypothetical protein
MDISLPNVRTIDSIATQDIVSRYLREEVEDYRPALVTVTIYSGYGAYYEQPLSIEAYKVTMNDGTTREVVIFPEDGRAGVAANGDADWFDATTVEEAMAAFESMELVA